ncbi:hypothetical protein MC885_021820, partial [Smutsia gigantea]
STQRGAGVPLQVPELGLRAPVLLLVSALCPLAPRSRVQGTRKAKAAAKGPGAFPASPAGPLTGQSGAGLPRRRRDPTPSPWQSPRSVRRPLPAPRALASCRPTANPRPGWQGGGGGARRLRGELELCAPRQPLQEETKMNAEPERRFGVVVVGLGRAGSVRMRDLRNPHASSAFLNLIGFVSRRELKSIDGVQQISLEDALSSQEVEFLSAGKHVLVEYPMTLSWAAAQDLWELAEQKGKVLHEEHVELLMEEFAFLKKEVVGKDLLKGSLLFTGQSWGESQVWYSW